MKYKKVLLLISLLIPQFGMAGATKKKSIAIGRFDAIETGDYQHLE